MGLIAKSDLFSDNLWMGQDKLIQKDEVQKRKCGYQS